MAGLVALLASGCVAPTVEDQPPFRKFEPNSQTSQSAAKKTAPETLTAPSSAENSAESSTLEGAAPSGLPLEPQEARVAILLPLTGSSASLGKAMLDAAQLSLFELANKSFVLLPFDTRSTAAGAEEAAVTAVQQNVQLILGPLHADSVRAVAPIARNAGVPVVAFSNSREVAGDGVFILGFVPRQQVNAVVGYALSEGMSRFAVLAPRDSYGDAVVEAARSVAEASGGSIVRTLYYDPAAPDLTGEVKAFANYTTRHQALLAQRKALAKKDDEVSRRALRRLERLDTIGTLPFDAVLLPEGGERLRTLSSLLYYFDVDQPAVRLLGLRSWDLIPNLGTEPALIGAWFAGSPTEERAQFNDRFQKTFGRAAHRLSTLAYDATALAVILAQSENGPDYSMTALMDSNGFLGVDGIFRLMPEGIAERAFAIHEVTRDGTVARRSAPQSFTAATN